jgi:hypothetical protein
MCDDDCPKCGLRHLSPSGSDELTVVIARQDDSIFMLLSPESAEHDPQYRRIARFDARTGSFQPLGSG